MLRSNAKRAKPPANIARLPNGIGTMSSGAHDQDFLAEAESRCVRFQGITARKLLVRPRASGSSSFIVEPCKLTKHGNSPWQPLQINSQRLWRQRASSEFTASSAIA